MDSILLLLFMLVLVLILVIAWLLYRIKKIESKLINFTPTEAYTIMDNMRDMVQMSEQAADKLDNAIRLREEVLEDICDLVDEKVARLSASIDRESEELDINATILSLNEQGYSDTDIARELGISVTEVRMSINLANR